MDKGVGIMLYDIATRFKGSAERSDMLIDYICDRKITGGLQLSGNIVAEDVQGWPR